jgi:hypothetical protein
LAASFQIAESSARAFSSERRRSAFSQSKMPPQQRQRPFDVVGDRLDFRAHWNDSAFWY